MTNANYPDPEYDVAIIGAGPTGLTIANLLGAAGVRAILIERNPSTVQLPRAVSIDDESLRTMQATGLLPEILQNIALDYGLHYLTPGGVCFLKVEPQTREYGHPRRNAFLQPQLEATLRDGLKRFDCVTTRFETTCDFVREHQDGVAIRLVEASGRERTINVRYLVGSDGGRSNIRKAIGGTLGGSTYDQRWLIVDLANTAEMLRQTRVMCDPERPAICLPGPHGTRRYEFMLRDDEDDDLATSDPFVTRLLESHGPDATATRVRQQVYSFHARVVDRWSTARMFLAGDAAHLSPPFAGQGMNSGLRDAHNIAWKLIAVINGTLGPGLLRSYQDERPDHARALIQLAVQMGRVMMPTSRMQAAVVQTLFRMTRYLPRLQEYFAEMRFKPRPVYRKGFLRRGGDRGIVGRMAPQPLLELRDGTTRPMDELTGNNFAVVAYGPQARKVAAQLAALDFGLPTPVVLAVTPRIWNLGPEADGPVAGRDTEDRMKDLAATDGTLVLFLRPDRYIAAAATIRAATDAAALAASVRDLAAGTWPATPQPAPPQPATA